MQSGTGVCLEQVTEARQTLEGRTDGAHLKGQDGNMQWGSGVRWGAFGVLKLCGYKVLRFLG